MALSFTPKFANMVRVTTTTQGTGPLVCGPAVAGFASFADSVSAGDSFYYSVQGVDKPQEREVGRGTYTATGTITRQPLKGGATNFTPGTKTVSLVAAAEWYAEMQELAGQSGGGDGGSVASRAALAAYRTSGSGTCYLKESGREGMFVWDATIPIATHQADDRQGIFVAPAANAAGAWVRRFCSTVNVRWFGAKGDNVANDAQAFTAALAYLKSTRVPFAYGQVAGALLVPAGRYFLGSTTLDLTFGTGLIGEPGGQSAGSGGTILRWTSGTTGIRTQAINTTGAEGANPGWSDYSAGRVDIRDLSLDGGFNAATMAETEAHGIHLRVTATLSNVSIRNFAGDGVYARAAAGGGPGTEGNVNVAYFERVSVENCRNGFYLDSADANACSFVSCNGSVNRRWGFWDSSFLGNTYIGCHSAANGFDGAIGSIATGCTFNGNRYHVLRDQGSGASQNAPSGTTSDNAWWAYIGPGGAYSGCPVWASGTAFRDGGSYRTDGFNSPNVLIGCYSEGDQGLAQLERPTLVCGGLLLAAKAGDAGGAINATSGGVITHNLSATGTLNVAGRASFSDDTTVSKGLMIGQSLIVAGGTTLGGNTNSIGPATGVSDNTLVVQSTNVYNEISLRTQGAVLGNIGTSNNGNGLYVQGFPQVRLFAGNNHVANVLSVGLDLQAGKTLQVAGTQVVGPRRTGWTAATGTPARGAFAAIAAGTASVSYVQAEAQEKRNRIAALEARLVALESDCRAHGLIN